MFELFKWSTAIASIIGVVLNIRKERACFAVWAFTNASWCAVDVVHGIWSQGLLQAIYFCLAILGWLKWRTTNARTMGK